MLSELVSREIESVWEKRCYRVLQIWATVVAHSYAALCIIPIGLWFEGSRGYVFVLPVFPSHVCAPVFISNSRSRGLLLPGPNYLTGFEQLWVSCDGLIAMSCILGTMDKDFMTKKKNDFGWPKKKKKKKTVVTLIAS